jgi:hypothetical protein
LKLYQALWAPYYQAALSVLGSTGVILPMGDPHHGQPNATTFTTKGEEQAAFTWSEAPSALDTPLDLTDPDSYQGIIPFVDFNGTDEEADTPDATYWSRGDGANDSAYSVGAWVRPDVANATQALLTKAAAAGGGDSEWQFLLSSAGLVQLNMRDASAAVTPTIASATSYVASQWNFVVATYDGTGGATAMTGCELYLNGTIEGSPTRTENAGYVAMENGTSVVGLGQRSPAELLLNGRMAGGPLGPFFTQVELTPDQVKTLYDLGRAALGL